MSRDQIFWKIYPGFILIGMLTITVIVGVAVFGFEDFFERESENQLRGHLSTISALVTSDLNQGRAGQIDQKLKSSKNSFLTELRIIAPSGKVLADLNADPKSFPNLRNNPLVFSALQNEPAEEFRKNEVTQEDEVSISVPIVQPLTGAVIGVVVGTTSLEPINDQLNFVYAELLLIAVLLLASVAVIAWKFSFRLTRPLSDMTHKAEKISQGDFTGRLQLGSMMAGELQDLGKAINKIAVQLDRRIKTILRQRNEKEAVFASMSEGLLVVDKNQRIRQMNSAASSLLGVEGKEVVGKNIEEVVRTPELQGFILKALRDQMPAEREVRMFGEKEYFLQVRSSPLKDGSEKSIGSVYVVNDVTRLRQLEDHRKEFVANVSHELKTPLTSIQGYAETLLNPAVTEDQRKSFLHIIHKQAERLGNIVEDLLTLSRLEREGESGEIELSEQKVKASVKSAMQICQSKAEAKAIELNLEGSEEESARINPFLFEQAVVNLVDNAIKYSPEKSSVRVMVERENGSLLVRVKDSGPGIPSTHLPRLFERFYRVDKARSRKVGGTGLGLSIVKHIVLAHHGEVTVRSEEGKGTEFLIHLPSTA